MKQIAGLLLLLLLAGCGDRGSTAIVPAATATAGASAEQGRVLFRNKGCVSCHVNSRVEGPEAITAQVGPDLSSYHNDPAFLRRWLADPAAVKPGTEMPNLQLSEAEIEGLVAFLNQPR